MPTVPNHLHTYNHFHFTSFDTKDSCTAEVGLTSHLFSRELAKILSRFLGQSGGTAWVIGLSFVCRPHHRGVFTGAPSA